MRVPIVAPDLYMDRYLAASARIQRGKCTLDHSVVLVWHPREEKVEPGNIHCYILAFSLAIDHESIALGPCHARGHIKTCVRVPLNIYLGTSTLSQPWLAEFLDSISQKARIQTTIPHLLTQEKDLQLFQS